MAGDLTDLVTDLRARLDEARLSPTDQVRALATLLAAVGWSPAQPGLSGDRIELEAALAARGDLASALILQGARTLVGGVCCADDQVGLWNE